MEGQDWESIVFGSKDEHAPTLEGRLVKGLQQVLLWEASVLILGSGASKRGGVSEARYTQQEALRRLDSIADVLGLTAKQKDILRHRLHYAELDEVSQNTKNEIEAALKYCDRKGLLVIVQISSAWHIERSHKEMLDAARSMYPDHAGRPEIFAVGSHDSTHDVAISEPPHRGDRPKYPIHRLVRKIDSTGRNTDLYEAMIAEVEPIAEKYEKLKAKK